MAIAHYAVFVPYSAAPLIGDGNTVAGLVDPFRADVDAAAFFPLESWSLDVEQTLNIGSQSTGAGASRTGSRGDEVNCARATPASVIAAPAIFAAE